MHISLDSALGRQRRLNSVGESVLQIAPSAAAAYSLRSLTGGDPKVVRVRRSSNNGEQDFTAAGISSGALTSFVNEDVELFSNDFETNTDGFTLNTGGSNTAVRNTSDGFSGSGCLQLNLTSSSNSINTVKTDTYMQDTDGVSYTVSFYAKAVSGSANLVLKIGTTSSSSQQISFSENGGEWVKHSLTFVNNLGAGAGNRNQRILFAGSTNNTTEWRIDDFQIVQTTSNGFVETWYDQSGNNNAVQATAGNQPKIVSAGSLLTAGVTFDGSDDHFDFTEISNSGAFSLFIASNITNNGGMVFGDNGGASNYVRYESANAVCKIANTEYDFGDSRDTSLDIINFNRDGSNSLSATRNSSAIGSPQTATGTFDINLIGVRNNDVNPITGAIKELLIYSSDQSSNRSAVEANIMTEYSIS